MRGCDCCTASSIGPIRSEESRKLTGFWGLVEWLAWLAPCTQPSGCLAFSLTCGCSSRRKRSILSGSKRQGSRMSSSKGLDQNGTVVSEGMAWLWDALWRASKENMETPLCRFFFFANLPCKLQIHISLLCSDDSFCRYFYFLLIYMLIITHGLATQHLGMTNVEEWTCQYFSHLHEINEHCRYSFFSLIDGMKR